MNPLQDLNALPPPQVADSVADTTASISVESGWRGVLGLDRAGDLARTGVEILFIALLAWVVLKIVDRAVARWAQSYQDLPPLDPSRQRALTVGNLIRSGCKYVIWPIAGIAILSELSIDVTALIATAGVAGLAIGFGAQTVVKDVISGVLLLFDRTISVGDRVRIGETFAIVEDIGVRLIKVRKYDGELIMVPAGDLRIFGNTSIGFSRAIIDIGVSYSADLDEVLPVLDGIAKEWAEKNSEVVLDEEPQVLSVMSFDASSIRLRIAIMMRPGEQFRAEREIRSAIKAAFDKQGFEIPFQQVSVHFPGAADPPS